MSFLDFDGEFASLKRSLAEELKNDKLVQRLAKELKAQKAAQAEEEDQFIDADEAPKQNAPEPVNPEDHYTVKPRKVLKLTGLEELRKAREEESKPRKRVHLTGIKELREKVLGAGNVEKPKKRLKLIPMAGSHAVKKSGEVTVDANAQTDGPKDNEEQRHPEPNQDSESANLGSVDEEKPGPADLSRQDEQSVNDKRDLDDAVNGKEEGSADLNSTIDIEDITLMKRTILSQLNGRKFPALEESLLHKTYKDVYKVLQHTVNDREGNTALLIGPRGTGKTLVIDRALENLQKTYGKLFITIKLDAHLHSDDKLALREVARRLDMNVGGSSEDKTRTFEQRAISDTFTNILLALDLNTSPEQSEEAQKSSTPIVFVINEIEKFTGSNKQTLLYNLFELTQSSKIPICVLGVCTKFTTRELLEKRVRSRFSQRVMTTQLPSTLEDFWSNAKLSLQVHSSAMDQFKDKLYPLDWNKKIDEAFDHPTQLTRVVHRIFHSTKSYKDLNNCLVMPVSLISPSRPFPDDTQTVKYFQMQCPGFTQAIFKSLSTTELLLTIAAARWIARSEVPQVNFNLAYKEYTDMMKQFNAEATTLFSNTSHIDNTALAGIKVEQKIWSPKVMRDSWDNLYKYGILFDAITSNNEVNANNNFNMYKLIVLDTSKTLQLDMTLEELGQLVTEGDYYKTLTKL